MILLLSLVACLSYDPHEETATPVPTPAPTQVQVPIEGGTFELVGGIEVTVPAEVLDGPFDLTVTDIGEVPDGYTGFSAHYAFGPEGAVFDPPILVRIPFTDGDSARMFWSNGFGGFFQPADQAYEDGAIVARIHHFSTGFIAMNTDVEEVVVTAPPAQLDVLFVIDDSCSMSEEQLALSADFSSFLSGLDGQGIDYHIGVTTTDMETTAGGLLRESTTGQRYITPATQDPLAQFTSLIRAGTGGSATETGRAAAYSLLELRADHPRNVDFYREEADLHLIFISDEQDQSTTPPRGEFIDFLHTLKPGPQRVRAHAITGFPGQNCSAIIEPGMEYIFYAQQTGGLALSICNPNFVDALETLGLEAAGRDRGFQILRPADPLSLTVSTETPGSGVELDWTTFEYLPPLDVVFNDEAPTPGDLVKFRYLPL